MIARLAIANLLDRAARAWRQSGERKPERSAERVDVRANINRAAPKLLRTREIRRADEFSVSDVHFSSGIRDCLGEAEVDDFHFQLRRRAVIRPEHDITRLEVAMDQTLSGSSHQCLRDLTCNLHNQLCIKRTIPTHAGLQRFALDQFHCVKATTSIRRGAKLEDSGHVWVSQGSRGAGFTQKSLAHSV